MSVTIKVRRDTAANWTSASPILSAGEFGYETDTGMIKIGDGTTSWATLSYDVVTIGGAQSITGVKTLTSPIFTGTPTYPAGSVPNAALAAEAWTAFTPNVYQGGVVSLSTAAGKKLVLGKLIVASINITANGAGTTGQIIIVRGLPESKEAGKPGGGWYSDASVQNYMVQCDWNSATEIVLVAGSSGPTDRFGVSPSMAVAANDQIHLMLVYEGA